MKPLFKNDLLWAVLTLSIGLIYLMMREMREHVPWLIIFYFVIGIFCIGRFSLHKIKLSRLKKIGVKHDAMVFQIDEPPLGKFLTGKWWAGKVLVQYIDGEGRRQMAEAKRVIIRSSDREDKMSAKVYVNPAKPQHHEVEIFRPI
ncbi:MAG: hypothetical protein FWB98_04150 [Defluviitaleaceae bacterium]|nr:hypothetical protein [Defluviitaleaceae bacterium]